MDLGWLVEAAEITAWADMIRAAPAPVAEGLGLELCEVGGGVGLIARRLDAPEFNRVMGLGLTRPATLADLEEIAATYRPLRLSSARLQPSPEAEPTDKLPAMLDEAGFRRAPMDWVKMIRDTNDPPEAESDLEIVETELPDAEVFAATVCAGYGMPPALRPWLAALVGRPDWRCYLALDDRGPVAAAALYLAEHAGWLGIAATRSDRRRRGAQSALIARRIADAGRAGRAWAVTETGAPIGREPTPSYDNIMRAGFILVHRRPNYAI
jgi:hypothetical protein